MQGKFPIARTLLTVAAVLGLVLHTMQLAVRVDSVTVTLLVVAALPWLGELFQSLELPGGWKVQFRALNDRVAEAEKGAHRAEGTAAGAARRAEVALAGDIAGDELGDIANQELTLKDLADEYDRVRDREPPGPRRTDQMNVIFRSMIRLVARDSETSYQWQTTLQSESGGERLAAYAVLYVRPLIQAVNPLVETMLTNTQRQIRQNFGEYWGVAALSRTIEMINADEARVLAPRLSELLRRFPEGTDRHGELAKAIERLHTQFPVTQLRVSSSRAPGHGPYLRDGSPREGIQTDNS